MIKKAIDIITQKKKLHLSGEYKYLGPGTPLRENILNLDQVVEFYKAYWFMPTIEHFRFASDAIPFNRLDTFSMYHDVFYYIAEKEDSLVDRMKIEAVADRLFTTDCRMLAMEAKGRELEDTKLALSLITCKMNTEECCKSCCILS